MKGQVILKTKHRVGEHHRHQTEKQYGGGVSLPGVLAARIDAQEFIGDPFDGSEDRFQKRVFAVEHLEEIDAERLGDEQQEAHVKSELNPTG